MSGTFDRRRLTGGAIASGALGMIAMSGLDVRAGVGTPVAPGGTPVSTPGATPSSSSNGWLVAADNGARQIHVFSIPDLTLVATIDGVTINDHAGFLPLTGGRLLIVDTAASELALLDLAAEGGPAITNRVPVREVVSHIAVDPDLRYAWLVPATPRRRSR